MDSVPLHDTLVHSIIATFFHVYNYFSYGFAESVYAAALERELLDRGHQVGREVLVPVAYKDRIVVWQRLDLLVDRAVIMEFEATEFLPLYCRRQLVNYLSAPPYEVGPMLHFGPNPRFYRLVHAKRKTPVVARLI